jgi:hypothetical protein
MPSIMPRGLRVRATTVGVSFVGVEGAPIKLWLRPLFGCLGPGGGIGQILENGRKFVGPKAECLAKLGGQRGSSLTILSTVISPYDR